MKKNRRDFLKKVAYVAPVILTMTAVPAFAATGSGYNGNRQGENGQGENEQGENEQ